MKRFTRDYADKECVIGMLKRLGAVTEVVGNMARLTVGLRVFEVLLCDWYELKEEAE